MNKKSFVRIAVLVVFAILATGGTADAQVMGNVYDWWGEPIQNTTIQLSHVDTSTKALVDAFTLTDRNGAYVMTRYDDRYFEDGKYLLEASAFGYQTIRVEVTMVSGYAYVEDLFLQNDLYGVSVEGQTFAFSEGTYIFWIPIINGRSLPSRFTADTLVQTPGKTKQSIQIAVSQQGGYYSYLFIPKGEIPQGSTVCGNVTIRSAKSKFRVYSEHNWWCTTINGHSGWFGVDGVKVTTKKAVVSAKELKMAREAVARDSKEEDDIIK